MGVALELPCGIELRTVFSPEFDISLCMTHPGSLTRHFDGRVIALFQNGLKTLEIPADFRNTDRYK